MGSRWAILAVVLLARRAVGFQSAAVGSAVIALRVFRRVAGPLPAAAAVGAPG